MIALMPKPSNSISPLVYSWSSGLLLGNELIIGSAFGLYGYGMVTMGWLALGLISSCGGGILGRKLSCVRLRGITGWMDVDLLGTLGLEL